MKFPLIIDNVRFFLPSLDGSLQDIWCRHSPSSATGSLLAKSCGEVLTNITEVDALSRAPPASPLPSTCSNDAEQSLQQNNIRVCLE